MSFKRPRQNPLLHRDASSGSLSLSNFSKPEACVPKALCSALPTLGIETIQAQQTGLFESEVKSSVKDQDDGLEFMSIEKEDTPKDRRMVLFQDRVMNQFKNAIAKGSFIVLLIAPSGHGKTHLIENLAHEFQILTEADCDEDTAGIDNFENLLKRSTTQGLKKTLVVIDNIEGLETTRKRTLSHFLKKQDNPTSRIRLILTSDSAQESPTKTLKTMSSVTTLTLNKYTSEDISTIVSSYALAEFHVVLKGSSIDKIVSLSQGNPRSAIQTFDFSYRTKVAKKDSSASEDRSRDLMPNLISQSLDLVRGKPPRMSFASSDSFFMTQLAFENSTVNRDVMSSLDIVSKNFSIDTDTYQNMLEMTFQVVPERNVPQWPRFPKASKKKEISKAAAWPPERSSERPYLKPHGLDAHDRLSCIRTLCAHEWTSRKMKRWTASSAFYDEDSDIRDLRKSSSFVM